MTTAEFDQQFEIVERVATVRPMYSGRISGPAKQKTEWDVVERETGIRMYQLDSRKHLQGFRKNLDWFESFLESPEARRIRARHAAKSA